jgi:hypothetical protein
MGKVIDFSQYRLNMVDDDPYLSPEDFATEEEYYEAVCNAPLTSDQEEKIKELVNDEMASERIKKSEEFKQIRNLFVLLVEKVDEKEKKYQQALKRQNKKAKFEVLRKKDYEK